MEEKKGRRVDLERLKISTGKPIALDKNAIGCPKML
jgi:hypothetical protein